MATGVAFCGFFFSFKVLLTQKLFCINKLSLLSCLLVQKYFLPWIFPSDVIPFQSKEVGCLFGPWTTVQKNGSSLLCDVISVFHSCTKQGQTKRDSFLFYRMPESCFVFGCNTKSDPENGVALHGKPFFENVTE